MNTITVKFEDHGQDFLEFDVEADGKIVGVRPFQFSTWSKHKVMNMEWLKVGNWVVLDDIHGAFSKKPGGMLRIKYPIKSIVKANKHETH